MNKRIMLSAGACLLLGAATFMASCDKKATDLQTPATATTVTHHYPNMARAKKCNAIWMGFGNHCIHADDGNCTILETVVVHGEDLAIRDAAISGPSAIGTLWSGNDIPGVKGKLDAGIVADLATGHYGMLETSRTGNSVTYIVGSTLPLTSSNMEYAVQFTLDQ